MDIEAALAHVREHHRGVLATFRADGRPQLSPVLAGVDGAGRVIVSSAEGRAKVYNLRREPRVSVCVFTNRYFGGWVQLDGEAEVLAVPDAVEPLVDYYRRLSGEHENWDEYRAAMVAERRVLIRFTPTRAAGVS